MFYADKLHLIEERNADLSVSIYNWINPNASINKVVSVSSKLFAYNTGFNLNRKISPCYLTMFRNSICKPNKPIVKFVFKYLFEAAISGSAFTCKPIGISNIRSS